MAHLKIFIKEEHNLLGALTIYTPYPPLEGIPIFE